MAYGRFVPDSTIRSRMASKDARMARDLQRRTAPHQTSVEDLRKVQDATRWRLVMLHPRPEIRGAGMRAWDDGISQGANPHAVLSIDWANWEAGWLSRHQDNT